MDENQLLAAQFERQRPRLHSVAVRLLGSSSEADDALQDAWLRASRADRGDVVNLGGWLSTIVARVCLTRLQSRQARLEEVLKDDVGPLVAEDDPERDAVIADALGRALLLVLDTLAPPERLAFVLHDLFAVPFDDVARVLGRTPVAARQLASRARRRVAGAEVAPTDRARAQQVVQAFLSASRLGEFAGLLTLLDPEVVLHADAAAVRAASAAAAHGAPPLAPQVHGAAAVAQIFCGRAQAARPALVDGLPGLVWAPDGDVRAVFGLLLYGDRILVVEMLADPDLLRLLEIELL